MNRRLLFLALSLSVAAAGCGGGGYGGGGGVPAAPAGLSATLAGTTANLSWIDYSSDETGFEVERYTSTGGWAVQFTTGANVTSATSSGLEPGTAYSFRVRAINGSGKSDFSNEAPLTVASLDQPNRNPTAPYSPNYLDVLGASPNTKGRWASTTITYSVAKGADSRSLADLQTMIAKSAARWNTATNGLVTLNRVDSGANIQISFATASDPDFADGSVGVTSHSDAPAGTLTNRVAFNSVTMKIEADVPDGQFVPLVTHELGHALGIGGHSSDTNDNMYAVVSASTLISARDANTLAKLYLTTD